MRCFFALGLDVSTARDVADWRSRALPPFARPVATDNLHATLVFLGELTPKKLREIQHLAAGVMVPRFSLTFDELGYWPKQEIAYLAPQETPVELESLVADLRQVARRSGIKVDKRRFLPHITLARRCESPPVSSLEAPDFAIEVDSFQLFESLRKPEGVVYRELESWHP